MSLLLESCSRHSVNFSYDFCLPIKHYYNTNSLYNFVSAGDVRYIILVKFLHACVNELKIPYKVVIIFLIHLLSPPIYTLVLSRTVITELKQVSAIYNVHTSS